MTSKEIQKQRVNKCHDDARRKALTIVGQGVASCSNCGCDLFGALEINHVNGGGSRERRSSRYKNGWPFYYDIVKGRRRTDDLNVLCRVCNAYYYMQTKYNIKYKIVFVK
jgi:hypothetical protein